MDNAIDLKFSQANSVESEKSWLTYLPKLLRSLGALAVLVSLYTFLAKGWDSSSDLIRYGVFLSHTLALAVCGFASGKIIKEAKGARLLFILALCSIPVSFSILGAFLFGAMQTAGMTDIPQYMTWSVGSLPSAVLATGATFALLTPVVLLGFRVLIRQRSKLISGLFIASNCLLLLPTRDPGAIAALGLLAGGGLTYFYFKNSLQQLAFKTFEGKIAMALVLMPVMILFGRNVWLHHFDSLLLVSAASIGYVLLRQIASTLKESSWLALGMQLLALVLSLLIAVGVTDSVNRVVESWVIVIPLISLIFAGLSFDISRWYHLRAAGFRLLAAFSLTLGLMLNLALFSSAISSLLLLAAGVSLIGASLAYQQKLIFLSGLLMTLCGLYNQLAMLLQDFDFSYWLGLAILGVITIVAGSYLEARGPELKAWLAKGKSKFGAWQY